MIMTRARQALPVFLLVAALVVAGAGAFQAHRAQHTHRATAEALLRDYGTFAAWSFAERGVASLNGGVRSALYPPRRTLLVAGDPEECLEHILAQARRVADCGCSEPLGGDFAFMVRLAGAGVPSSFVGAPPAEAGRSAVLESVAEGARSERGRPGHGVVEVGDGAGGAVLVGWTRVTEGADTVVYGIELSPERVETALGIVFADQHLLPESLTRGASSAEMLAVRVTLASGRVLYGGETAAAGPLAGRQEWPAALGGGVVSAAVLPQMADRLIIGGLPRNQVPWLLIIFALSAGLALVAVTYLRREALLARQRADFVASVSHELRTPLAQIRLFVETLRLGRTENASQREWALAAVDRETLRLTRLVENVLQFTRSERGRPRLEREPLSLAEEAEGVVRGFEHLLKPRQASIQVDVPAHLQVEAHRDALRQVLLNLLDNAAKYGPAGQTIQVRARVSGPTIRLEVEDEGPGVPPAERKLIWESFRRGERTVGSVVVGNGIGLSVVRALVTGLGGRCHVEDSDGGGARFVVELPALVTPRAARLTDDAPPTVSAGAPPPAGRSVGAA